jgi:hypothetical protein
MPPCSKEGCNDKSYVGGLCAKHYREYRHSIADPCSVEGCGRPAVAHGLCNAHFNRKRRIGSLDIDPRVKDRGLRHGHPLYESWRWFTRSNTICDEWRKDFWDFVNTVGDRPSPLHVLRRVDLTKPLALGNWYWKEKIPSKDKADYARQWAKRNPDKVKNSELKKRYGITKDVYDSMLDEQGGVCALCGQTEMVRRAGGLVARDLAVDHDHATGRVRGLLCTRCNFVIAAYEAFPNILNKAQSYLEPNNNTG